MAEYINKIVLGDGTTLLDISPDTVTAQTLHLGVTAHDRTGAPIVGSSTLDSDTSDANAQPAEILESKTAYVNAAKLTGTMPNRGAFTGSISDKDQSVAIPQGYHDGSGYVVLDSTEKAKLVPQNVRKDISILGIVGTMDGTEDVHAQSVIVSPLFQSQTVTPDAQSGYNYLNQVTVEAIPVVRTENAAGGYTVTIGAAGE